MDRVLDTYGRAFFTNNPIGHRPDLIEQSQEGLSCKQRCIRNRHGTWLTGLTFGFIAAVTGAAFCITRQKNLMMPGIILSVAGMAVFIASILFAGLAESVASDRPGLPPPAVVVDADPDPEHRIDSSSEDSDEINGDFY